MPEQKGKEKEQKPGNKQTMPQNKNQGNQGNQGTSGKKPDQNKPR